MEYDGTNFSGWQLQPRERTVQGELEGAVRKLNGGRLSRVHGAGRTDAGVHARGQVANFKLAKRWKGDDLRRALNGNVDDYVSVRGCEIVPDSFHARYSALRRRYQYYCLTRPSVIGRQYVWHVPPDISVPRLRECAKRVLGRRDFMAFCKHDPERENHWCLVNQSQWIKRGNFVIFVIEANRFLQHLIRFLVGTMMEAAKGNLSVSEFQTLLDSRDPRRRVFKAPPNGLFLENVTYP